MTKKKIKEISLIKKEELKININFHNLKYKRPKYSAEKCIVKGKTYSLTILVPIKIEYKKKSITREKYIILGELPLITKKGSFIINGNTRIIITQIVRSPGIYFSENKKEQIFAVTIIPEKGSWLTIKLDKENLLFMKIDKIQKKIPMILVLKATGLTHKKILNCTKKKYLPLKPIYEQNTKSTKQALKTLSKILSDRRITLANCRSIIYSKFLTKETYDLGKLGREKLNKKLYKKKLWTRYNTLIPEDLLGSTKFLIQLKNGKGKTDDIDDLKNKRIKLIGEFLDIQIMEIVSEIKKNISEKIKKVKNTPKLINIHNLINKSYLTNSIKKFFTINQLSQLMEETNPLTEVTHKRKISSFGIGALDKKNVNLEVREIHPSHYGRICPIETAEGKNAGLIWSLAKEAKVNKKGFIETPFYKVIKNSIKTKRGIFFLSCEQEKKIILAPADTKLQRNKLKKNPLSIRKNNEFYTEKTKKVEYIGISPIQIISVGTALIPFLEHDDANRALMGSNMQRQAVTLTKTEKAIVQTGIESLIAHNTESTITTNKSGIVKYSSNKKIIIHENINTSKSITIKTSTPTLLMKLKWRILSYKKYNKYTKRTYNLKSNTTSNQNIYSYQIPSIKTNSLIKKRQIVANGPGIYKNKLCLGKNILIGYMPWEGYNFEDAIIISEKLVMEETFSSIHIKKYKTFLIKNETEEEKFTKKIPNIKQNEIKKLKANGIIRNGTNVKEGDIIVGKIKISKKATATTQLLSTIFKKKIIKNTSLKISKGIKGTVINIKINQSKTISITIYIAEKRKIEVGDKISGRHGNKGIISKIIKIENMPYLQDGTPLEMILNPLGIPSRMNLGQVFESLLGIAGKNLKENYQLIPFDEMYAKKNSEKIVFNKLYESSIKTKKKWVFNMNYPGKMKILNGKTGDTFKQPITVGYAYMLKLMHLVKDKITARSLGAYSMITKQPLKGKARNGGQRFGEMEVWAIEGFGAAYTLQELLTIKSDDLTNRYKTLNGLITGKSINEPNKPEAFKVLILELKALCINIEIYTQKNRKKIF